VRNSDGEEFGEDKLLDFLKQHSTESAKELNTKLLNHIEDFRGREPWPDDITVLTCKVFE
jgi:sigma-B regulation protein RsbU (phosphoserine phosphatase)